MEIDYSKYVVETPLEHIKNRWAKVVNFNDIRQQELLEMLQYSFLYLVAALPVASLTDWMFPDVDENKDTITVFAEVVAQILLNVVILFYLTKLVKVVPFLFQYSDSTYVPYLSNSFSGSIVVSLAYLSVQKDLMAKLKILSKRFVGFWENKFSKK
jgi:hypothetical protein